MLESIRLQDFRSFEDAAFNLAPLTVITGNNGRGKTSILEAVSMLSLTTSWKTERDTEAVRWGAPFCRVTSGVSELVVQVSPYMKRMRVDGVAKRASQVIGMVPSVLFQPDDMSLLGGAPTYRRHYLDRVVSQTSPQYTQAVLQMGKVLKQRNRLLKNIAEGVASEGELDFWDLQLAEAQEIIGVHRRSFLDAMGLVIPGLFAEMVPDGGEISITYHQSPANHSHSFVEHLAMNRMKEIAAGSSLYGPHREDIEVFWGEHPVHESMSRGQSRSLLVAFKIAELQYITEKTGKKPILLLDDIFSELDTERRERLVKVFGEYQVVMTTTELGTAEKLLGGNAAVIAL